MLFWHVCKPRASISCSTQTELKAWNWQHNLTTNTSDTLEHAVAWPCTTDSTGACKHRSNKPCGMRIMCTVYLVRSLPRYFSVLHVDTGWGIAPQVWPVSAVCISAAFQNLEDKTHYYFSVFRQTHISTPDCQWVCFHFWGEDSVLRTFSHSFSMYSFWLWNLVLTNKVGNIM